MSCPEYYGVDRKQLPIFVTILHQEKLADQFGFEVLVCHYPSGASKWNPIEHRVFSQISRNWVGQPLRTFNTLLNYIRYSTTETGLKVKAFLVDRITVLGLGEMGVGIGQQL